MSFKVKRRPSWISRSPHRMGTVHRRKSYDACFLGLFRSLNWFLAFILPFKWVSRSNGGHLGFQGHLIEWEPFIVESPMIHVFWVFLGRWINFWHNLYNLNAFSGQTAAILDFKVTSVCHRKSSDTCFLGNLKSLNSFLTVTSAI